MAPTVNVRVKVTGADEYLAALEALTGIYRWVDGKKGPTRVTGKVAASSLLRKGSKEIADRLIVPNVRRAALRGPNPAFDVPVAATARGKADRLPVVKIGTVQPRVSGVRRTNSSKRRRASGTLAYGSELGPKGGGREPREHLAGGARPDVNYYKRERDTTPGHWAYPAQRRIAPRVAADYERMFRKTIKTVLGM